jgi:HEAT repeat protein
MLFRGQVGDVKLTKDEHGVREGVAVISVDRWYRGRQPANFVKVHFAYQAIIGHDCIDFRTGTYWIIFAKFGHGEIFELADDCVGALAVSALLGPEVSTGFLSQMEADFAAGLSDSDSEARIASIQRLAGLGKISSAEALHRVIASGTEEESKWAIFAALKVGDSSVLPLAVPILLNLHHEEAKQVREPGGFVYTQAEPYPQPEGGMALAISNLRAPEALPVLTKLANEVSDDLVRRCARGALQEINTGSGVRKSD